MEIKNHPENADLFKSRVKGARLSRGRNIPNKNIISLNVIEDPLNVNATIQGSGTSKYIINIYYKSGENNVNIIHDCPDFKKGNRFCKHVVKLLLILEPEICHKICDRLYNINFSSNTDSIQDSKVENFLTRAKGYEKKGNFSEAISYYEQAYHISKDNSLIKKIIEMSMEKKLYDTFFPQLVKYEDFISDYIKDLSAIFKDVFENINDYNLIKQFTLLDNARNILKKIPERLRLDILKEFSNSNYKNNVLKYLFLKDFESDIYWEDFFTDLKFRNNSELLQQISKFANNESNEAFLNMEPMEIIEIHKRIAERGKFNHLTQLNVKKQNYSKQVNDLFIKGLNQKHAFLRSLVISYLNTDKLNRLKFTQKRNYSSILWTSVYRSAKALDYYVLEKCGIERHHLQYISNKDFIHNYPVYKEIFDSNNPIPHEIKNFWGNEEPRIKNIVFESLEPELDLNLSIESKDFYLIEWDLAKIPLLGSYVCQFYEGFIIPDETHPLTNQIKPFDLILCFKKPVAIKSEGIKILRPSIKVNVKTAINLVWNGIDFISYQFPFQIIKDLKIFKIDEVEAIERLTALFQESFLPDKDKIHSNFLDFIQIKIRNELNSFYQKLLKKPKNKDKILRMIGFDHYSKIFKKNGVLDDFKHKSLSRNNLEELRFDFKKFISQQLINHIKDGTYEAIDIKKLKKFYTFRRFAVKIIHDLKLKLEGCKIYVLKDNEYDVSELMENYYGSLIIQDIINKKNLEVKKGESKSVIINKNQLRIIMEHFDFLKLNSSQIFVSEI